MEGNETYPFLFYDTKPDKDTSRKDKYRITSSLRQGQIYLIMKLLAKH